MICPYCETPIEGIRWEATLVRSNVSEAGVIGGAVFDTVFAVPPGTCTLRPCKHQIDPDVAKRLIDKEKNMTTPTPTPDPAPLPAPEIGLGDVLKLLKALEESVLQGAVEVPPVEIHIAGKTVVFGPCPCKIVP